MVVARPFKTGDFVETGAKMGIQAKIVVLAGDATLIPASSGILIYVASPRVSIDPSITSVLVDDYETSVELDPSITSVQT